MLGLQVLPFRFKPEIPPVDVFIDSPSGLERSYHLGQAVRVLGKLLVDKVHFAIAKKQLGSALEMGLASRIAERLLINHKPSVLLFVSNVDSELSREATRLNAELLRVFMQVEHK